MTHPATLSGLCLAWALGIAPTAADAQESAPLTLAQALETARASQPRLRQARAVTDAARARVDQAGSGLLPQVQAQAAYTLSTENRAVEGAAATLPGANDTSFSPKDSYSAGLAAQQLLWDFRRTSGTRDAAAATAAAQEIAERDTRQQIDLEVRTAFCDAHAQKALLNVARETLQNEERHTTQIGAFIEAGTRPAIDGFLARTQRANAQVALVNAENAYLAAKARLNLSRGIVGATSYDVADELVGPVQGEDGSLEGLVAEAEAGSPALRTLVGRQVAAQRTLASTQGGLWPVFDATASLNEAGPSPDNLAPNWSAALRLTWPLYQGGLTTAQIQAAVEERRSVEAQAEVLRQSLRLQVEQARLGVVAGKATIVAAQEAVANARERLRLAEGRYETGVGSSIELTDAQLAVTNAAAQVVKAERDLAVARAQILAALGRD